MAHGEKPKFRLTIDKLRLDDELSGTCSEMAHWSDKYADAKLSYDKAKLALKIKKAQIGKDVRQQPEAYGVLKATENAVDCEVVIHKEVIAAEEAMNQALYELNVVSGAIDTLGDRKTSIRDMVELYVNNYWADSRPKMRSEDAEQFEKEAIRNRGARRRESEE